MLLKSTQLSTLWKILGAFIIQIYRMPHQHLPVSQLLVFFCGSAVQSETKCTGPSTCLFTSLLAPVHVPRYLVKGRISGKNDRWGGKHSLLIRLLVSTVPWRDLYTDSSILSMVSSLSPCSGGKNGTKQSRTDLWPVRCDLGGFRLVESYLQ